MSYLLTPPQLDYEQQLSEDEQNHNLDPEDLLPEDVFPAFSEKKTLLIPKLQSMKSYIAFHYKKPITKRLCQWVNDSLRKTYPNAEEVEPLPDSISFTRMDFWRVSRTDLLADIHTSIDAYVYQADTHVHIKGNFIVELFFDMSSGIKCLEYEIFAKGDVPSHEDYWQLTDHLIPILKKADIEDYSAQLLRQYHYEGWCDIKKNSPFALAKNMGLKIKYLPLHKNQKTRSILFFSSGTVTIDRFDNELFPSTLDTESSVIGKKIEQIEANTIVINTNAVHKDHSHLDVFHECIHSEWHYLFFRLQDRHNNDLRQIRKIRTVQIDRNTGCRKRKSDPLSWIEYQAIAGSFALWMPWTFMQKEMAIYNEAHHNQSSNRGVFFDGLSREIAMTYEIPKFRVRARFIRMGYIAARGALNYTDKHYIQPFAFDLEKGSGNYTFFITREQVASEYKTNSGFRLLLNSGRFVYVDGHICLNDPQYVIQTQHGPRLTRKALDRVDLCCLRFEDVYEQDDAYAFRYGRLNSDLEYNKHFLYFPPVEYTAENPKPSVAEQIVKNGEYIDSLPRSFPAMLKKLMIDCDVSEEELAFRSQLSSRTIDNLRNKKYKTYKFDSLLALVIGLHLPPWVSQIFLAAAAMDISGNAACQEYAYIFQCMFMDDMETIKTYIQTIRKKPMDLSDYSEENAS